MTKMKNNEYPTWLVPLDIAQELKKIDFNEPCHFYYQNDYSEYLKAGDPDKYHIISDSLAANRKNANHNNSDIAISTPTWEQVFEWFRARGYKITFKDINIGTQCAFYHLDIKEGHTFSHFAKKYEKAREALVMKLIEVHKEFGNNIKRK
nr:MAG TPA: hypothetical protein [Caudoviricetes sp.]DAS91660.1 MAG TPA: hypothetical protein [Caudoviricetes sp.]